MPEASIEKTSLLSRLKCAVKPAVEWLVEKECCVASLWVGAAHRRLLNIQWRTPPKPENFDHHIDLFYGWKMSRNSQWVERGAYGSMALKGGRVLELCCGDGFNAKHFYSLRSTSVVACDFDPKIIQTANRKNSAPNVTFLVADIRTSMPEGVYENIVWDASIEHFTEEEIAGIIRNIKRRLAPNGVISGHTVVERTDGVKQLSYHEYEFKSKEDLLRFFQPYFRNVSVFETVYPKRHNLYFWASDSVESTPFASLWPHALRLEASDKV
ncbi:MAG: class I SAM-dependent methyltransferase [Verrucomicrobia bacterium]|nr:class I SAM-dependent methyltransferase [Verrucomicrobiota bacterium]